MVHEKFGFKYLYFYGSLLEYDLQSVTNSRLFEFGLGSSRYLWFLEQFGSHLPKVLIRKPREPKACLCPNEILFLLQQQIQQFKPRNLRSHNLLLFRYIFGPLFCNLLLISRKSEDFPSILLVLTVQWCQIENQQRPVYVVNSHFLRCPDGC